MFSLFNLIAILLGLAVVLTYSILLFKQQKKLAEKKTCFLLARKELQQLKNRGETLINELESVKPEFRKYQWDLKLLRMQLNELREDIRIIIRNIRHDRDGILGETTGGLSRVVERREAILKDKLGEYSNHKAICIGKQHELD